MNKLYFPDNKNIIKYDTKNYDTKLSNWLKFFLKTNSYLALDNYVLKDAKEREILIKFIVDKTLELFDKMIKQNGGKIHKNRLLHLFIMCFFITYKLYTVIDYQVIIENKNKCFPGINLTMLSNQIPSCSLSENIDIFNEMELDILERTNWMPFKEELTQV